MKNIKVLVTGATGFVGRQVVRSLADHGAELHLVVRASKESLVRTLPKVARSGTTP